MNRQGDLFSISPGFCNLLFCYICTKSTFLYCCTLCTFVFFFMLLKWEWWGVFFLLLLSPLHSHHYNKNKLIHQQIHETVETINQLKTNREFFLSFARDPQEFMNNWLISQTRDLKVSWHVIQDVCNSDDRCLPMWYIYQFRNGSYL